MGPSRPGGPANARRSQRRPRAAPARGDRRHRRRGPAPPAREHRPRRRPLRRRPPGDLLPRQLELPPAPARGCLPARHRGPRRRGRRRPRAGRAGPPPGGGTGLSGATCNVAVVVDTSKYMREVVEVDADASTARVQAGCIRDHLSHPCEAEHGLTFAPDTATHAYATLGGMIGSNACGVHSLTAGRTSDNVEELHVLLYDGTRLTVGVSEEQLLDETVAAGGGRGRSTRGCASCAIATPTAPASSTPTSRAESRATTSTSSCPSGASTSPVRSPAPRAPA